MVANTRLRERMTEAGEREGLRVLYPPLELCTDNAAMIATRRRGQARSGGTDLAGHRRRPQPKVGAVTTVLVTGGAGFIGSQPRRPPPGGRPSRVAVDDLSTGRIANLGEARGYGKAYTFFNMDVRAEGLASLFERHRPEVVFHLAAQAGVRPSLDDPVHDASVNLMGTLNVLECARARSAPAR